MWQNKLYKLSYDKAKSYSTQQNVSIRKAIIFRHCCKHSFQCSLFGFVKRSNLSEDLSLEASYLKLLGVQFACI